MRTVKGFNFLKILIFSLCILFSVFTLSCENIINNNKASFSVKLNTDIKEEIQRTSSFSSDTLFNVEGLLYKKDKVAISYTKESKLENINDITFSFTDIPFADDYKVQINLIFNEEVIYTVTSEIFTITEENPLVALDLSVMPNVWNITYELNGGLFNSYYPNNYSIISNIRIPHPSRKDSEFLGWYLTKDFSGDKIQILNKDNYYGDVTLYARWRGFDTLPSPLFSHNGKEITSSSYNIDYNEVIRIENNVGGNSKVYYTVDGSTPSSTNGTLYDPTCPLVITKGQTIKAITVEEGFISSSVTSLTVDILTYKVQFNNGGHGTLNTPSLTIHKGPLPQDAINSLNEVGYTFSHWQDSEGIKVDSSYIVTKDTTITAVWTINQYTITYVTNTTEEIAQKTVDYNYSLTSEDLRTNLVKEHNDFAGWFIDSQIINTGYRVTTNITLTAKWTRWDTVSNVTITPSVTSLDYGDEIILETATSGATIYYTLDGTNPLNSLTTYSTPIKVEQDINLRAIAKKDHMVNSSESSLNVTMKLYTIQFSNGGHGSAPLPISGKKNGDTISLPSSITDPKFHFTSWDVNGVTKNPGDTIKIDPSLAIEGIITITALWEPIVEDVTFSKKGDVEYLDTVTLTSATPGATIYYTDDGSNPIDSPTKKTYTTDISIDKDETIKAVATKSGMYHSSVTEATYTILTHQVIFNTNGSTSKSPITGCKKGQVIQLDPITDVSQKFMGWQHEGQIVSEVTMGTQDITVIAQWETTTTLPVTISNYVSGVSYVYKVMSGGYTYKNLENIPITGSTFNIADLEYNKEMSILIDGNKDGLYTYYGSKDITLSSTTENSLSLPVDVDSGYIEISCPDATFKETPITVKIGKSTGTVKKDATITTETDVITVPILSGGSYGFTISGGNPNEKYTAQNVTVVDGQKTTVVIEVAPNNVYFVSGSAASGGNGTEAKPFNTLKPAVDKGGTSTIYVGGTINEPNPITFGNQTIVSKVILFPPVINIAINGSDQESFVQNGTLTLDNVIIKGGDFPTTEKGVLTVMGGGGSTLRVINGASIQAKSGTAINIVDSGSTVYLDGCGAITTRIFSKHGAICTVGGNPPTEQITLSFGAFPNADIALKGDVTQPIADKFIVDDFGTLRNIDGTGKIIR